MTETQRRLRKWRMTSLVMWSAYACVLLGAASAALAVFYGANGRYVLAAILGVVAVALFGGALSLYSVERRIEADPATRRDMTRVRRANFASAYGEKGRR